MPLRPLLLGLDADSGCISRGSDSREPSLPYSAALTVSKMVSENDHLGFLMPQRSSPKDQVAHPLGTSEQQTQNEVRRQCQSPTTPQTPATPQITANASDSSGIDGFTASRAPQTSSPNTQAHDPPFTATFQNHVLRNDLTTRSHDESECLQTPSTSVNIGLTCSQYMHDNLDEFNLVPKHFNSEYRDIVDPSLSDLITSLAEQQIDEEQGPWTSINTTLVSPYDPSWPVIPFELGRNNFDHSLGSMSMTNDCDGTQVEEADIVTSSIALPGSCSQLAWFQDSDLLTLNSNISDVDGTPEFPSQDAMRSADLILQEQLAGTVDIPTLTIPQVDTLEIIVWDILFGPPDPIFDEVEPTLQLVDLIPNIVGYVIGNVGPISTNGNTRPDLSGRFVARTPWNFSQPRPHQSQIDSFLEVMSMIRDPQVTQTVLHAAVAPTPGYLLLISLLLQDDNLL